MARANSAVTHWTFGPSFTNCRSSTLRPGNAEHKFSNWKEVKCRSACLLVVCIVSNQQLVKLNKTKINIIITTPTTNNQWNNKKYQWIINLNTEKRWPFQKWYQCSLSVVLLYRFSSPELAGLVFQTSAALICSKFLEVSDTYPDTITVWLLKKLLLFQLLSTICMNLRM